MKHIFLLILIFIVAANVFAIDKYEKLSSHFYLTKKMVLDNKVKSYTVKQVEPNTENIWVKYNYNEQGELIHKEYNAFRFDNLDKTQKINYYYVDDINQVPEKKSEDEYYCLIADSNLVKSFWRNNSLIKTYKKKGLYAVFSEDEFVDYKFYFDDESLEVNYHKGANNNIDFIYRVNDAELVYKYIDTLNKKFEIEQKGIKSWLYRYYYCIDSTHVEKRYYNKVYEPNTTLYDLEYNYDTKCNAVLDENQLIVSVTKKVLTSYFVKKYYRKYNVYPPFIRNYNDKWIEFNYTYTYEYYE